jgi:hypothetical protein
MSRTGWQIAGVGPWCTAESGVWVTPSLLRP